MESFSTADAKQGDGHLAGRRAKMSLGRAMAAAVSLTTLSLLVPAFADETPAAVASDGAKPAVLDQMGPTLRVGDKLRLAFYEKFDDEQEKWGGKARAPGGGYHQFTELCGDYVVQDDGTISLPIIGRFPSAGRGRDQLLADLTRSFQSLIGRGGFVNVISTERQPVFVVGAVKNPGAFKYWQGMTVLHAVALAGGIKLPEVETWQKVETEREMERLQRSLDKVKRLLVRTSLLRAESGGVPIATDQVRKLVGADASALLGQEQDARKLTAQTVSATSSAMTTAIEDARQNVKARTDRLGLLDSLIAMRTEREKAISQLVDHDTVSRPVLVQTQSELADAQDRKRQALIEVAEAKQRLAEAEHDYSKHQTEASVELARLTQVSERDTEDAVSDAKGALDLVSALTPKGGPRDGLPETYDVVRKTDAGTVVLNLPGTALLEPGDLVRLSQDKPDADSQ